MFELPKFQIAVISNSQSPDFDENHWKKIQVTLFKIPGVIAVELPDCNYQYKLGGVWMPLDDPNWCIIVEVDEVVVIEKIKQVKGVVNAVEIKERDLHGR